MNTHRKIISLSPLKVPVAGKWMKMQEEWTAA